MKIKDCMCQDVKLARLNTSIYEVSKLMSNCHIGSVPICDEKNKVCGIITDRDIVLRGVACDKDLKQTNAKEIMSVDVCTCKQDETIDMIEDLMIENQVRRILVCDDNEEIVGIVSFDDIAKNSDNLNSHKVADTIEGICEDSEFPKNSK